MFKWLNPTIKSLGEDKTILGFWWSMTWRLWIAILLFYVALGLLGIVFGIALALN
jgi:hypothetical protein